MLLFVVGCFGVDGGDSYYSELCFYWGVRIGLEDNFWSFSGNGYYYYCIVRGKFIYLFCIVIGNEVYIKSLFLIVKNFVKIVSNEFVEWFNKMNSSKVK